MASILSHPAVPLALRGALGGDRVSAPLLGVAVLASVLPDADALGFSAGIPYGHVLGHRGLTHSLFFAALLGAAAAFAARPLRSSPLAAFLLVFVSAASHGLLDMMTTGGLGVAYLAPFSARRSFLPWRVIEVSPIGVAPFFSEWGARVLLSELRFIWAPAFGVASGGLLFRLLSRRLLGAE